MRKIMLAIALALPAAPADLSRQIVTLSDTKTLDVAGAGAAWSTLRFENSRGGVSVEGWDKPQVEITIVKSTTGLFDPKQHDEATRWFDAVHIASEPTNGAIVISTDIPKHDRERVHVDYVVKAPRGMKIEVGHHAEGDVSFSGMLGDIDVTTRHGQITIDAPEDARYSIDAHSRFGDVYSDFEGQGRRRHLFHHDFNAAVAAGTTAGGAPGGDSSGAATGAEHKLLLRAEIGDIVILKNPPIPVEATINAK